LSSSAALSCRVTVNTVSITSRLSTRSLVQSEQICSPPSPEDEYQRSLPAKAPASRSGCVRMASTMGECLLHPTQPPCKHCQGFLSPQGFCLSSKSKADGWTFCVCHRTLARFYCSLLTACNKVAEDLFYSCVERPEGKKSK
jgi:hypothetical protein